MSMSPFPTAGKRPGAAVQSSLHRRPGLPRNRWNSVFTVLAGLFAAVVVLPLVLVLVYVMIKGGSMMSLKLLSELPPAPGMEGGGIGNAIIGTFLVSLIAALIAIPVGVYAATRPYSLFDQIASTLAFIGFSLPTFFTGILLILFFSIHLDWLPFVYRADIPETGWRFFWEHFKQMIMPVTVLGLFQAGAWTRYVRSAVLDVIRLDYVTTARSKGLAEKVVITKHVLRNALIPVVTLVALQMPAIFGGAIVTEQIFRVPGIGSLIISSMLANDTPVVMAVTFVFSTLVIACNLLADILYGWLDPRISFN